jgi:hypothetical protein
MHAMARFRFIDDPDALKEDLQEMIRQIHEEADPLEMNEYKRFVKQNISVFSRAYFTAYMVKKFIDEQSDKPKRRRRPAPEPSRSSTPKGTPSSAVHRNGDEINGIATSTELQTLFVSVGKNRRVFPKDLIGLFSEVDAVSSESFGQIKILDSYSFVEVEPAVADQIIETYDGQVFRGRKLKVNYARSKKED